MQRSFPVAWSMFCALTLTVAQEPPTPDTPQAPLSADWPQRPGSASRSQDPQPYDKVITKDAKSKKGIFTVHQVKDKYYYEIPFHEFEELFLWNTQIAKTTLGVGYGGQELSSRVVYWQLNGTRVFLRTINYDVVADPASPISQAVKAANNDAILMSFPVAAFASGNSSAVIDVTRLFTSDLFEFSARQRLNATTMDASRSYIERISAYPENIEAEASLTYTKSATPLGQQNTPVNPFLGAGMRPGSATIVLHHSMVKLPNDPMPRLFDERVGYFSVNQMDYGRDEQR